METLYIRLDNIHCDDCKFTINKALDKFAITLSESSDPQSHKSDTYTISGNDIHVFQPSTEPRKIVKAISKKGFKILSWDYNGFIKSEFTEPLSNFEWWAKFSERRRKSHHLQNCAKCQEELNKSDADSDETVVQVATKLESEYRVVFTIEGMTCAACVGSVEAVIKNVLDSANVPSDNFSVNLLSHSAVVIVPNKHLINKISDSVSDSGFDCKVVEALPVERSINTKVTAVLGGITCAACANSIYSAVKELPFILECGINAVSKTGVFVMEGGSDNLEKLQATIEDCGFDFELISSEKINYASKKSQSRTINISISGMFCGHCPDLIIDYLNSYGEAVVIEDPITLSHPFIKLTYIPNPESNITIRKFLFDLNHLVATDNGGYKISDEKGTFNATLVEKVSMDEHLRKLSRKETMKIVRKLVIATLFAIPTFVFGIVAMALLSSHHPFRKWVEEPLWVGNASRNTWILLILSTPVYFFAADIFHVKAFKEIRSLWVGNSTWQRRLFRFGSMNLLMCLGTSVAYFASIALLILSTQQEAHSDMGIHTTYFDSVVFLTFFLLIGRLLESFSKNKTADAISDLTKLKQSSATLESGEIIDIKYLETGDLINVATGEAPPVDCTIIQGTTEFDESALTGESKPVKHIPGHQIFSGTVNVGSNSIVAKVSNMDGDSLIDQIVNTVRDGQLRKAPIARTADLLTGYFVPIIVFLAIITWIIWLALGYSGTLPQRYLDIEIGGWAVWSLEFCIAVFVIACPCGIGLAAPTALFVGSGLAAKYGILAKGGGAAFQDGANTSVVCFDKTGTLTHGELQVTDYMFINDSIDLKKLALQTTRDLEISSKHPLAEAIRNFIKKISIKYDIPIDQNKIPQVTTVPGKGLSGDYVLDEEWLQNPTNAILGNESLMEDYNVKITEEQSQLFTNWKKESKSIILVAVSCKELFGDAEHHLIFAAACRDQLRAETKSVIEWLHKNNIECYMITGDNSLTANAIGSEIGIPDDHIISEVLPDQKQSKVEAIQKEVGKGKTVAMIGDGINDAPAMASADVGIALSSGADIAVSSSDFIILNRESPLSTLVTLLDLSRVVFRRVKFNFCWSLIYNVVGIPIAAGVIYPYNNSRLSPVWASAAMALSSISVVSSSLALKLYRPKVLKLEQVVETNDEAKEVIL